jgi:hypothetical protein
MEGRSKDCCCGFFLFPAAAVDKVLYCFSSDESESGFEVVKGGD